MLFLFLACSQTAETERTQLFTRAALDLRGTRPSIEELDRVSTSDRKLEDELESLLYAPEFGWQYAQSMSGFWKTEVVELDHRDHEYSMENYLELITAMGQEPLQILAEIARNDLPYSEFVTGAWTVSNEVLGNWAPVAYPQGETGWKKVSYTDGRPAAGVLVSNGLWWRYNSTQNNANRGRVNILSKNLLCNDFLERNVSIDRNLSLLDQDAIHDAIANSPTCYTCHSSLDQFASNFWGFYRHFRFNPTEQFSYHFERERDWSIFTGVEPGYFGTPTRGLDDLGQLIAEDPQYYACVVERTMEQFYHRPLSAADTEAKHSHLRLFLENNQEIRSLVRSIISDPEYRNIEPETQKQVTIQRYGSQLKALTGYRFSSESLDVLDADLYGLRSMSGGVGSDHHQPHFLATSPTFALVIERLAQAASMHVTQDADATQLFFGFSLDSTPTDEQLERLFRKTLSRTPKAKDLKVLKQLWSDILEVNGSTVSAWQGVSLFLFRHPDFLRY